MIAVTRAERFESARTEFNMHGSQSIAEVSKATAIQASMISDLENNDKSRGVSYEAVAALAQYYGVFADYLMGLSAVPSRSANAQDIARYTGLSLAAVERLSARTPLSARKRELLDRLLSAEAFPSLLEALNKTELAIESANRAIAHQKDSHAALGLSLFEERLGLSVFRVVKAMTELCYEILPIKDAETRLASAKAEHEFNTR